MLPRVGPERCRVFSEREAEACGSCDPRLAPHTTGKKERDLRPPPRGSSKFGGGEREVLGSDKQVVLTQSFRGLRIMYITKVDCWRGMAGWHRA